MELQALKEDKAKKDWKIKDSQRELADLDVQIIELKNQLTEQSSFQYLKLQVAGNLSVDQLLESLLTYYPYRSGTTNTTIDRSE